MTLRLYYEDPYLKEFEGKVLECRRAGAEWEVRLDRSAFYPTSGGQPFDTGVLGESRVLDVFVDKSGEVWHRVDAELPEGETVTGKIDWERRFDHMQQHAGEHMLANAAWRLLGGHTIGLHLGREEVSIDMDLPEGRMHITPEELHSLEDDVNGRIQRDVPIRQWFPTEEELKALPLRKAPAVTEHVRVVQIGTEEYCACGGTHPSSAGQIGLVKILEARPSKGKLRLTFVCGRRAFELLRKEHELLHEASEKLSTSVENLPTMVGNIQAELREAARQRNEARTEMLLQGAEAMYENAPLREDGIRVICRQISGDMDGARALAANLTGRGYAVAALAAGEGPRLQYVVSRSPEANLDCGKAFSQAARATGGKGGGRSDFAQGAGPAEMLEALKKAILKG